MGKHLNVSQDENGYFTLQLPQPSLLERVLPPIIRTPVRQLKLRGLSKNRYLLYPAVAAGIIWLVFTLLFFVPGRLSFATGSDTCAFNPMLLPRLSRHSSSISYAPYPSGGISIGGYPLLTTRTCLKATQAPVPGHKETARIAFLHIPFLGKNLEVTPAELPQASARFADNEPVGSSGILEFELTQADQVFGYRLAGNGHAAGCAIDKTTLTCGLEPLELAPGAGYELVLERIFAGEPADQVLKLSITTLDPVIVTDSSISHGSVVYDSPQEIVLTANKTLGSAVSAKLRQDSGEEVAATVHADAGRLTIRLTEPLARSAAYFLIIDRLTAEDGSDLAQPYRLDFEVSGGPKVAVVSVGSSRVPPGANIALTFDVGLKGGQDFARHAKIEIGGQAVASSVSVSGNRLTINPRSDLPRCTAFRIIVSAGLISQYDIGGGEAWSMNSRTLCQVAFSIGRSVQGRSIVAYRFGNGNSKIVFVGGMHGNEKSSVATLHGLINYLEDNAGQIPAHRSIIIIPNHNPDGYARSSRTNARGVDLNRNFPAHDWQSSVQMPGGITAPAGGGNAPLDQPESAALAAFINQQNPRLVLTYHAVARVVISNDAGDSASIGRNYAADSGYRFTTDAGSDDEFGYATTGEFEDWLGDARGTPAILVELSSMSANQFSTHRRAMMNIVKLP